MKVFAVDELPKTATRALLRAAQRMARFGEASAH
jgi:hypothetical protein